MPPFLFKESAVLYTVSLLLSVLYFAHTGDALGIDVASAILVCTCLLLYYFQAKALTGQSRLEFEILEGYDPSMSMARKATEGVALYVLFLAGGAYFAVAMFFLPHFLMTFYAEVLGVLLYLGVIDIVESEEDLDDEQ